MFVIMTAKNNYENNAKAFFYIQFDCLQGVFNDL